MGVGVGVGVGVAVGLAVAVGVAATTVRTRTGGCEDSRLARLIWVVLLSVRAKLTRPRPPTSDVTSTLRVLPAARGPDDTRAAAMAGAFVAVVAVSLHVVLATA